MVRKSLAVALTVAVSVLAIVALRDEVAVATYRRALNLHSTEEAGLDTMADVSMCALKAANLAPGWAEPRQLYADSEIRKARKTGRLDALPDLRPILYSALRASPAYPNAYLLLSVVEDEAGDPEKAEEYRELGFERSPCRAKVVEWLASTYLRLWETGRAKPQWEKAISAMWRLCWLDPSRTGWAAENLAGAGLKPMAIRQAILTPRNRRELFSYFYDRRLELRKAREAAVAAHERAEALQELDELMAELTASVTRLAQETPETERQPQELFIVFLGALRTDRAKALDMAAQVVLSHKDRGKGIRVLWNLLDQENEPLTGEEWLKLAERLRHDAGYLCAAKAYIAEKKPDKARALLRKYTERNEGVSGEANYLLFRLDLDVSDLDAAELHIRRAIELTFPTPAYYYSGLGTVLKWKKDFRGAAQAFNEAIDRLPSESVPQEWRIALRECLDKARQLGQ